ncbi:MAG TPA: hypothetical protein VGX50_18225 [Longimicrobium sp.]|nr:hypothetical protein [Longimicrobium sp.]
MRTSLLAVTAGLALAACAPSRPEVIPAGETLNARLDRTSAGLAVGMSEPGYVAVFAVVPGWGVGMVYPTRTRPSRVGSGWTNLLEGYRNETASIPGNTRMGYLVLMASREPLDVEEYIENTFRLKEVLGPESALGYDREAVEEAIAQVFGAGRNEEDWEMDIVSVPSYALGTYVSTAQTRLYGSTQQVDCVNGQRPGGAAADAVCAPRRGPPVRRAPAPRP